MTASGDVTDPVPEMDNACLTLTGSCVKNCEGTVYATGFEWNKVQDIDDNTLQVTARCVAEATCGDSDEREAQPAELSRGTTTLSMQTGDTTVSIPSWDQSVEVDYLVTDIDLASCGSDTSCMATTIQTAIEAYDIENEYDNYEVVV